MGRILGLKEKLVFDLQRNDRIIFKNVHKTFYVFGGIVREGDIVEGTVKNVLDNCIVVRVSNELVKITIQEVLKHKVEILNIIN